MSDRTSETAADPDAKAWQEAFLSANGFQPDMIPEYEHGWFVWRDRHGWLRQRVRRRGLQEMTARLLSRAQEQAA